MTLRARVPLVAALLGLASLLVLDGWLAPFPSPAPPSAAPAELSTALRLAAEDLSRRAETLGRMPEVARSLEGGGIAVNRASLFSAARNALDGAPPPSWIALTDADGTAHAWWGEAPASLSGLLPADGLGARWSATTLTLLYRRSIGTRAPGIVYAARDIPVEAPDFARALGLAGEAMRWEPAEGAASTILKDGAGRPLVGARPAEGLSRTMPWRDAVFAALLAAALLCVGRGGSPWRTGGALALLFLGIQAWSTPAGHVLATWRMPVLALGMFLFPAALAWQFGRGASRPVRAAAGYGLLLLAFLAAKGAEPSDIGARPVLSALLSLAAMTALIVDALAVASAGRGPSSSGRWMTSAILVTGLGIAAGLSLVSPSVAFPAGMLVLSAVAFELWARAVGASVATGAWAVPRLLTGAALLAMQIAAPLSESERARRNLREASEIRLPDPGRASADAAFAAARASDRVRRFDLGRRLPAPLNRTDISDLAYRLWKEGEKGSRGPALISYQVFDGADQTVSGFSLIPAVSRAGSRPGAIRIERHEVAVLRQDAPLLLNGRAWGRVAIEVADWPSWDPLPPQIEVYRRLVLGESGALPTASAPRPFVGFYARDGENREEAPALDPPLRELLRRSEKPVPVRLPFRDEELWGEIRPVPEGYRLVAVPGPDLFGRLLNAAMLIRGIALLYAAAGLLSLWKILAGRARGDVWIPRAARTFRGRLVTLYVIGVMIPLVAVTFFLRSSILGRSEQYTLDHARTALTTARRVLDDYLPSASSGRGRLFALDDALLYWLANAVGYDLSVYAPDSTLVATSRRDLYAAGLLPDRVAAFAYVAIGLAGAGQQVGSRVVSGGRFEEVTTGLEAVPGEPGVRSPGLLSLLLLPQRRVAEAEAAQLTAGVSAFSLLVFLLSALVAGRLALRVARPVADLVEGTRAVARGDFSPRLAEPPDEELKELVRAFLSMSRSLKLQTEALMEEKERIATLLAHLTAGVVAYREGGRVLLANPAAAALGGGRADGEDLEQVFPGPAMARVRDALSDHALLYTPVDVEPMPGRRWRVVTVPLPLGGEGARMAVLEDVSDVVRSNRLAAWAEMARIIAHEIKNPLTPIRLSVEHLREVWRRGSSDFDRVLEECVANVLHQTDELRRTASEFSDYARLPEPEIRPTDVGKLLSEAAAAYAGSPGVRWVFDFEPDLRAPADARLLSRVFSNLIVNAVEALKGAGGEIRLSARRRDSRVFVSVEDSGPGVDPEILPRLFDPYFSAKSGGTGLGLAIAKKIVEEHGGSIAAENRPGGGFRVLFDLPRQAPVEAPA